MFSSVHTILYSHQLYLFIHGSSSCSTSLLAFGNACFVLFAILIGVYWCLTEVSICIFLVTNDAEHLFKWLFIIYIPNLIRDWTNLLFITTFFFLLLSFDHSVYTLKTSSLINAETFAMGFRIGKRHLTHK